MDGGRIPALVRDGVITVGVFKNPALTAPSKIGGNALISRWTSRRNAVTAERNVDTTVDAARLEARATKRTVGTRIFMTRAWAIGPWTLPVIAVLMEPRRSVRGLLWTWQALGKSGLILPWSSAARTFRNSESCWSRHRRPTMRDYWQIFKDVSISLRSQDRQDASWKESERLLP